MAVSAANITGGAAGMAFYCPGRSENSADAVAEGMGKAVECGLWAVFLGLISKLKFNCITSIFSTDFPAS